MATLTRSDSPSGVDLSTLYKTAAANIRCLRASARIPYWMIHIRACLNYYAGNKLPRQSHGLPVVTATFSHRRFSKRLCAGKADCSVGAAFATTVCGARETLRVGGERIIVWTLPASHRHVPGPPYGTHRRALRVIPLLMDGPKRASQRALLWTLANAASTTSPALKARNGVPDVCPSFCTARCRTGEWYV